ncbi:MAG: methyltransferase [Pseudomonadota bacterium]
MQTSEDRVAKSAPEAATTSKAAAPPRKTQRPPLSNPLKALFSAASTTLRSQYFRLRDRLLTQRAIRQRAASCPLTRPLVRRRAQALFDLTAGFLYFQVLHACVRLDLFAILARAPATVDDLAARFDLPPDNLQRLLDAAVALRLLSIRDGHRISQGNRSKLYGLGDLGVAMVDEPGLAAMVRHHAALYDDVADPIRLIQHGASETQLHHYWSYAATEQPRDLKPSEVTDYSNLMAQSQSFIADEVIASYRFAQHASMVDIGGGQGAFAERVARAAPNLNITVFDLPAVAEIATARFDEANLSPRCRAIGGSFFTDPLPAQSELMTLVRVCYDHPDERVSQLLRAVFTALRPGGRLLIAEPMSGVSGSIAGEAYFGLYLLAMGRGRSRSPEDFFQLLQATGFQSFRRISTRLPLQTSVIVAHK